MPAAATNGNSGKQQLDAAKALATAPTLARFVRRSVLTPESDTVDLSSCFSYCRSYPLDRRRARPITVSFSISKHRSCAFVTPSITALFLAQNFSEASGSPQSNESMHPILISFNPPPRIHLNT